MSCAIFKLLPSQMLINWPPAVLWLLLTLYIFLFASAFRFSSKSKLSVKKQPDFLSIFCQMEVIQLATPAHFTHGRVERIGLLGNQLFVAFRDDRNLEVWSVHYLVPSSWSRLFRHSFHDLFYAHCAVSEEQNAVFVLVAAFFVCFKILLLNAISS